MITSWRLTRPQYAVAPLSGEGSARYPGRWNLRGVRVVYVSESLSLATLEVLAHAENVSMLNQYVALKVSFPSESLTVLTSDELPDDWQSDPAPDTTRQLGNTWFNLRQTLALKVPSTLIPNEHNFLLNPAHPGFDHIDVAAPIPLPFDGRILKAVAEQPD